MMVKLFDVEDTAVQSPIVYEMNEMVVQRVVKIQAVICSYPYIIVFVFEDAVYIITREGIAFF